MEEKMKKLLSIVMLLMVLSVSSALIAKDMNGKFGAGYQQSLGGVSGLNIKYWLQDIGIDVTLGMGFVIPDKGDSAMTFKTAIGGIFSFARSEFANLGIGARINLGFKNKAAMEKAAMGGTDAAMGGTDSSFQFGIEVPLVAEYFLSDHFAINGQVGFTLSMIPEDGCTTDLPTEYGKTDDAKSTGIGIGNGGGVFGGTGFTFYF
jgi:hypothetical protein